MIEHIRVENFLGFEKLDYTNVSPVTVILGKNDTGKTGLLKLLYAVTRSLAELKRTDKNISLKSKLGEKLNNTFFPRRGGIGSLVTRNSKGPLDVELSFKGVSSLNVHFTFTKDAVKEPGSCSSRTFDHEINALFIPAKEVLTAFKAIPLSRENFDYEEFDDTYFDLIKSLRITTGKGRPASIFGRINGEMEDMFEGEIVQNLDDQTNPYLFKKGNHQYTMPLTAEGIKKVGILTTLLRNRELRTNTVVFLDEPETALHPEAQRKFAEMIYSLSNIEGVKIFLATHSYFMINQFYIIARREKQSVTCLSLEREKGHTQVSAKIADLKDGLPDNSIINEVKSMFYEDMKVELGR